MQLTTAVLALLASIATPALADCQLVNSGPGEEAGKAVFDFFIRDFVQPQFYDKVCPLGQEPLTGDLPGKWCGVCDGAELRFLHDGAFDNRCFNADDVYDVMDDVKWSYNECGYNIKTDAYLTLVYGSEGFLYDDCENHCVGDA